MVGQVVSLFELSRTLAVGGGLLVSCSLPGPPIGKITHANGYYGAWPGWSVSISVLPLTGSQSQTGLVTEYTYKLQCQLNHQRFIF